MLKTLESQMSKKVVSCFDDPFKFVSVVFPWMEPGTELANYKGPRQWQSDFLRSLGDELKDSIVLIED